MTIRFNPSPEPTLGVEVELQIVDGETLDHVPAASQVLAELGSPATIKHELFESTVEINTGICKTVGDARADLEESVARLRSVCDRRDWTLMASGTHPFNDYRHQVVSPSPRYRELTQRVQYPMRRLAIFGIHYHVGMPGPEETIAVMNAATVFIPHLLALSASSPFWLGHDTGMASLRAELFEALPTAGIPDHLENWGEFLRYMEALMAAGAISSVREVWTDIRPHPDFGTIEFRICDATPTMSETMTLAALTQALVVWLTRRYQGGDRLPRLAPWILRENKWRASRFGLDADLITADEGSLKPLRASIADLVAGVTPIAAELGCDRELAGLDAILTRGPSATRQRLVHQRGGDCRQVAAALIEEFATGRMAPSGPATRRPAGPLPAAKPAAPPPLPDGPTE